MRKLKNRHATGIIITLEQRKFLDKKNINLSLFVRRHIDALIKKEDINDKKKKKETIIR